MKSAIQAATGSPSAIIRMLHYNTGKSRAPDQVRGQESFVREGASGSDEACRSLAEGALRLAHILRVLET